MNKAIKIIFLLVAILLISKTPLVKSIPIFNAAAKAQTDLQQEFTNITPLPDANLTGSASTNRLFDVYIQAKYTSASTWEEISNHYLQEATENDWEKHGKTETVWNLGKDGRIDNYRKGSYYLSIECENINVKEPSFTVTLKWQVLRNIIN